MVKGCDTGAREKLKKRVCLAGIYARIKKVINARQKNEKIVL